MKKILRLLALGAFCLGTLQFSAQQEGKKIPLPANVKPASAIKAAAKQQPGNNNTASTACGVDTIVYPYLKELVFSAPNDSFFVDAMVGNVRTASQGYINNNTISVRGIQFWGGAYSTGSSPQTLTARAILYSVNAAFQPTMAIDSANVIITQNYDFYEAMFTTPVNVSGNFAVAVKNSINDTIAVITNNAGAAWQTPAYNEALGWRRFGSGTWNSNLSFFGQDLEYMIFPIVSYNINASFTASSNSVCPGTTITFSNTSTGPLDNRMFNLYTFDYYWGNAMADSTFQWNYGASSPWTTSMNGSYTYTAGGTYTTSLASEIIGYYSTCQDTATMTVVVRPSYNQTVTANICKGNSYSMGAQNYTATGMYTQTLSSVYSCDSIVNLNLTVDTVDVGVSVNSVTLTANATGATYQWIDCAASNTAIAGATGQTFVATSNGNYAVVVTQSGCSDTSACMVVNSVGLKNYAANTPVVVHPNPSTGNITVNCGGLVPDEIIVKNLVGQEVKRVVPDATSTTIDLQNLPASVYFVNVLSGNNTQVIKIMKQ